MIEGDSIKSDTPKIEK